MSSRMALSPAACLGLGAALGMTLSYLLSSSRSPSSPSLESIPAPSPLIPDNDLLHPYPPSILPGRRVQRTPYGRINVYEFGPAEGEKVLFLPGIGTPILALGDMALALAERGYRVCLFDLFGRGYSDCPVGVEFDERLYASQVMMVLAGSEVAWTGREGFHLVGYSLGGGLAVAFSRWWPEMVRSLVLVAGAGLIRRERHVGWRSRVLYNSDWLPEGLVEWLVERRIRPVRSESVPDGTGEDVADEVDHERKKKGGRDSDADGGKGWDSTLLSKRGRPDRTTTVADVMDWQIGEHKGFVRAFVSTIRHAPIYDQGQIWAELGELLTQRRRDPALPGLRPGKALLVLGTTDSVVVKEELLQDATAILGSDALEVVEIESGHELPFTHGDEVADAVARFWKKL